MVYRIFHLNPGTPKLLPVELVDFFKTKEHKRLTDEEPIAGIPTLFDQLRRFGATYFLSGFLRVSLRSKLLAEFLRL